MSNVILRCENLSVGYNNEAVVEDINFEINRGEITAIIGVNGTGKSTLLKTIAGVLPAISGNISLDDISILNISKKDMAKKMSLLLTDKINSAYMTCRDVVATGRYAYTNALGMLSEEDKIAIDEAIEAINIKEIEDRLFDKLSDGQKQRVMLARAICQKPDIIVLDEPTSFLDIGYKIEIVTMLQKLAKNNMAILMTMHDLDIAKKVSDKVISIKNGRVDRVGSAGEIFEEEYLCKLYEVDIKQYKNFYE